MTPDDIQVGFACWWPKAHNPTVWTVTARATFERAGHCTLADDLDRKQVWSAEELCRAVTDGHARAYVGDVPPKARKRLLLEALGNGWHLGPEDMKVEPFEGGRVFVGISHWMKQVVGVVDEHGRKVRKRATLLAVAQSVQAGRGDF